MSQVHLKTTPTKQNMISEVWVFGFTHTIKTQLTEHGYRVPRVPSRKLHSQCPIFWKGEGNIWAQPTCMVFNFLVHLKPF